MTEKKKYSAFFVTSRCLIQVCFLIAQAYDDDIATGEDTFSSAADEIGLRELLQKAIDSPVSDEFRTDELQVRGGTPIIISNRAF